MEKQVKSPAEARHDEQKLIGEAEAKGETSDEQVELRTGAGLSKWER